MLNQIRDSRASQANLPNGAPNVRVTAGAGTVSQKSWNLLRPVTLIGSQRKSHIVLHDATISKAHCVIVNTGTDVLLKDLNTPAGTIRNDSPINLGPLHNGNTIDIGETRIDVAVSGGTPTGLPGTGNHRPAPTRMTREVTLRAADGSQEWKISEAVTLLGQNAAGDFGVGDEAVTRPLAVIFRLGQGLGVFDLGESKTLIDGQPAGVAPIREGQTLSVGGVEILVGREGAVAGNGHATTPAGSTQAGYSAAQVPAAALNQGKPGPKPLRRGFPGMPSQAGRELPREEGKSPSSAKADHQGLVNPYRNAAEPTQPASGDGTNGSVHGKSARSAESAPGSNGTPKGLPSGNGSVLPTRGDASPAHQGSSQNGQSGKDGNVDQVIHSLQDLEQDLAALQKNINASWKSLNDSTQSLADPANDMQLSQSELFDRIQQLERFEAELRGQLHDLTQCHDQVARRERELAAQAARIHEERLKFFQDQAAWAKRKGEMAKRAAELDRRERLLIEKMEKLEKTRNGR